MIVISAFKDYYDGAMGFGYDPEDVRYVRELKSLPPIQLLTRYTELAFTPATIQKNGMTVFPFIVGIAGKLYYGVECVRWDRKRLCLVYDYFYTFMDLDNHLKMFKHTVEWEHYDPSKHWYRSLISYENFLAQPNTPNKFRDKCIQDKIVIIVGKRFHDHDDEKLVLNYRLANIQFYKVLDPYTVYQEIEMWIGGLPKDDRPMVTISDKDKIHKHGFDEWSFRKPPGGK